MIRKFARACALLAILLGLDRASAQQQFDLRVPDTDVRSTAELTERSVTIIDDTGQRFVYTRRPELDSVDGSYRGFLNSKLRRAIRWPADGRGAFHIGTVSAAGQITYRKSQMLISRVAGRPVVNQGSGPLLGPAHIGTIDLPAGESTAAYIDGQGQLQFAIQQGARWRLVPGKVRQALVPGAPLALAADSLAKYPAVYTTSRDGSLLVVRDGRDVSVLSRPNFVPGGQVLLHDDGQQTSLFSVTADGRLAYDQLAAPGVDGYLRTAARLSPGGTIAALGDGRLYTIDRTGSIRGFRRAASRWEPHDPLDPTGRVLTGFVPGGAVAAVRVTPPHGIGMANHLLSVDSAGRLQAVYEEPHALRWQATQIPGITLPPGAPVAAHRVNHALHVSATLVDGGWYNWRGRTATGPWTRTLISRGFSRFTPVRFSRHGRPRGFALDRRGLLVTASLDTASVWHPMLVAPGFDFAPVLVSREVVPNPELPPAKVTFENTHSRELWLLVTDLRTPTKPRRLRLKPKETVEVDLDRDAGGQLVERLETLRRIEERAYDIPPRQLYDVSVYELFLQSVAIDRTKRGKGKIEDVNWAPKSIGIFPVPPGNLLRDGSSIDVFAEAKSEDNPGGVRRLDMSRWKIDDTIPKGLRIP